MEAKRGRFVSAAMRAAETWETTPFYRAIWRSVPPRGCAGALPFSQVIRDGRHVVLGCGVWVERTRLRCCGRSFRPSPFCVVEDHFCKTRRGICRSTIISFFCGAPCFWDVEPHCWQGASDRSRGRGNNGIPRGYSTAVMQSRCGMPLPIGFFLPSACGEIFCGSLPIPLCFCPCLQALAAHFCCRRTGSERGRLTFAPCFVPLWRTSPKRHACLGRRCAQSHGIGD